MNEENKARESRESWGNYLGLSEEYIPNYKSFFIILDDLGATKGVKSFVRTSIIDLLTLQARHYNISMIGIFQQYILSPITFRENLEGIIVYTSTNTTDMRALWKENNKNLLLTFRQFTEILNYGWKEDFLFILTLPREKMRYYQGFKNEIKINVLKYRV